MISPATPPRAKNVASRVWTHYGVRGRAGPGADMPQTTPATNEPLLRELTEDFVKHGYDLKQLTRLILSSRAYQTSSKPNATNAEDDRFYSRYLVRRLPAETLLDAVSQVTGQPEKFAGVPKGVRAISLPD